MTLLIYTVSNPLEYLKHYVQALIQSNILVMELLVSIKNLKNFANICHHQDFGFKAERHFFTTSHGTYACDGIGGTVKRLAASASL